LVVRRSGLREAYVAMDALRSVPHALNHLFHTAHSRGFGQSAREEFSFR
jgi:hypothetical protein